MQQHCTELTQKLLNSVDKDYNVIDMVAVVDVITALEKTTITKEELEITRLGKHINEIRRQLSNVALAKRAKDLVRRWREMIQPKAPSAIAQPAIPAAIQALNGTKPQSPAARVAVNPPGIKSFKPQSPLLRDGAPLKVLSPALSLHSDKSRSPNLTPIKQQTLPPNYRLLNQPTTSPILTATSQNHSVEAVPRTHSANKRLRKDDSPIQQTTSSLSPLINDQIGYHIQKKPRLNGENVDININTNSQVPSPIPINSKSDIIVINDDNNVNNDTGPKKRGRKKGSKSLKNQHLQEDRVKEKLASISRNPKLKTTQELLADLQARGSSTTSVAVNTGAGTGNSNRAITTEPPTTEEILRGSDDNNSVYNRNSRTKQTTNRANKTPTTNGDDNVDIESLDSDKVTINNNNNNKNNTLQDLTVEQILAKLPPLDRDAIRWSDDEEEAVNQTIEPSKRQVTDEDVDRLHNECIEGLNGNYQLKSVVDTSKDDKKNNKEPSQNNDDDLLGRISGIVRHRYDQPGKQFREWHEMLSRPSVDENLLHIMPYVIID